MWFLFMFSIYGSLELQWKKMLLLYKNKKWYCFGRVFDTGKKLRQLIAKFRTSDHCLQIETGRYINIPRQQRLCTTCNILEDEYHFFLNCHLNQQPRNLLINTIENKYPSFTNMSPMNRRGQVIIPTAHFSDSLFLRRPLFRQPIAPTAHFSDNPLIRQKWSKVV